MVDDQINWNQRIDFLWVATEALHRIAHGCQVHDARNPCEILKYHSGGLEGHFELSGFRSVPLGKIDHVLLGDLVAVTVPQCRFEQDPDGEREFRDRRDTSRFETIQAVDTELALWGLELIAGAERVHHFGG